MVSTIKKILAKNNISEWSLVYSDISASELFFIKKNLDMRRAKDVEKYRLTVYNSFSKDGCDYKGSSSIEIVPFQSESEIESLIKKAYFAASFVRNKTYDLPKKEVGCKPSQSGLAKLSLEDCALAFAEALYSPDDGKNGGAFVNSSEIFVKRANIKIMNSNGTEVSYCDYSAEGEFVVQCKEPEDVEMHFTFEYNSLNTDAIAKLVKSALSSISDRAVAKKELKTGTYDVILSDRYLAKLMGFFAARTSASLVYPGYSNWKIGDDIQKSKDGKEDGEKINVCGVAKSPYSFEGIAMRDIELVKNGVVRSYHGGARLCSYLGIEPTGDYEAISSSNGKTAFDDMKKKPYLYPIAFSDFQVDENSGFFGGEMRLAYYFDGKDIKIVTGGSVNGNMIECINSIAFSKERYEESGYCGPFAARFKDIKVAGSV